MHLSKIILSIFYGLTTGYVYTGYKYYGTINPYKQTYERLIQHSEDKYNRYN